MSGPERLRPFPCADSLLQSDSMTGDGSGGAPMRMTQPARPRQAMIDLLKAVSCQMIVWHHLAFYGPMSDVVHPQARWLIDNLYRYGRAAVYVFLVVAGYLAAASLMPAPGRTGALFGQLQPARIAFDRYLRLARPYWVAILIAILFAAIARQLFDHPATPAEPHQRNLAIIHNQTERITNIVQNLLNLSRTYELRRRPVNLSRLMDETVELVQPNADGFGVMIEKNCVGPGQAYADPNLLQQVFLNILKNGIQAMPQGGRLRIECLEASRDGVTFAAIQVSDTGKGIQPEHLENVFDPFFTTKEVGHGTGLGLTVSSRIVEEHGGWIEAENNEDAGATFTVFLPVAAP